MIEDGTATATSVPATEDENLNTGLLDQHGKYIHRKPARIKMGFDLNPNLSLERRTAKAEKADLGRRQIK